MRIEQTRQQRMSVRVDQQTASMLRAEKSFLHGIFDELDERIEVPVYVQERGEFSLQTELRPGPYLEEFIHGADAAGKRDECVGKLAHHGFALRHRFDDAQLGDAFVSHFLLIEYLGNNADDSTARRER